MPQIMQDQASTREPDIPPFDIGFHFICSRFHFRQQHYTADELRRDVEVDLAGITEQANFQVRRT